MRNLNKVVEEYLKERSNYAVLVSGEWGVGKTYYYKESLEGLISETKVNEVQEKNFTPVHISLFGVKSISDIEKQIFVSFYPILKKKGLRLSATGLKVLSRGVFSILNLGDIDKYLADISSNTKEVLSLSEIVLCFDDLERRSEELKIEELIGYINSLVEHEQTKVILLANEDKLKEREGVTNDYSKFKEKVIGVTIDYAPDFETNVDSVIEKRYVGFSEYSEFLKKEKRLILNFEDPFQRNLRFLIFALDKFQPIFSEIHLAQNSKFDDEQVLNSHRLRLIFKFHLAVSIEFQKGKISFKDPKGLNELGPIRINEIDFEVLEKGNLVTEPNEEKPYKRIFSETYYGEFAHGLRFYRSIFNYITGGDVFRLEHLNKEIAEAHHLTGGKMSIEYEVLEELITNHESLSDSKYRKLTSKIVRFAAEGKYELVDYEKIFRFAVMYDNPLSFDEKKLTQKLLKGLRKSAKKHHGQDHLTFPGISEGQTFKSSLIKVMHTAEELNTDLLASEEQKRAEILLEKMHMDWNKYFQEIRSKEWQYKPVFKYAKAFQVMRFLNHCSLKECWDFFELIRARCSQINFYIEELLFFEELEKKLKPTSKKRQKKTRKNYVLNRILQELEKMNIKMESK